MFAGSDFKLTHYRKFWRAASTAGPEGVPDFRKRIRTRRTPGEVQDISRWSSAAPTTGSSSRSGLSKAPSRRKLPSRPRRLLRVIATPLPQLINPSTLLDFVHLLCTLDSRADEPPGSWGGRINRHSRGAERSAPHPACACGVWERHCGQGWPHRIAENPGRKVIIMTTKDHQNRPQSTAFPGVLALHQEKNAGRDGPECEILENHAIS